MIEEFISLESADRELESAVHTAYQRLVDRDYSGYEPYDILNSPYLSSQLLRRPPVSFALIQFGRRVAGIRFRKLLRVPTSKNPKALGLALAAICDLTRSGGDYWHQAQYLKSELKRLRSPGEGEYCWGYDWDYMSLRGTKLPAFSPNCIASYFCGEALLEMSEVFDDREAGAMAESVGRFILNRLTRSIDAAEHLCFSYTPTDNTKIFNNSALAAAYLARLSSYRTNTEYLDMARRAMNFIRDQQLAEGGWYYGTLRRQRWIDGFHTSYVLCALHEYREHTGDRSLDDCIHRGHEYYKAKFFTGDGAPKYFHNRLYPIDVHSCSQAILHFCTFAKHDPAALERAAQVFRWTQENMLSAEGSYFFQRHRLWTNRAEYARWGQAWMLRAMARLRLLMQEEPPVPAVDLQSVAGGD